MNNLTFKDIIKEENELILNAEKKYDTYFKNAANFNCLLQDFIKSVDPDRWIFIVFLSQIRKHHTLALFSTVRQHYVQACMDLRQVIEAGINAAYGIACSDEKDFMIKTEENIIQTPKKLFKKRYKWLEKNYITQSNFLKNQKEIINRSISHSNIVYAFINFDNSKLKKNKYLLSFFDKEDDYRVKTNLWFIGNLALGLMDLFFGINKDYSHIKFSNDFIDRLKKLEEENKRLKTEIMKNPRYVRAIALKKKTI